MMDTMTKTLPYVPTVTIETKNVEYQCAGCDLRVSTRVHWLRLFETAVPIAYCPNCQSNTRLNLS